MATAPPFEVAGPVTDYQALVLVLLVLLVAAAYARLGIAMVRRNT